MGFLRRLVSDTERERRRKKKLRLAERTMNEADEKVASRLLTPDVFDRAMNLDALRRAGSDGP